ncbi:MAG: outer membrane beta-barrel protein [Cyclobacteriaceae bacterium]
MKHALLIFGINLFFFSTHAQRGLVTGIVSDSTTTLPSATVMLLQTSDSTLVNFGVTNNQGVFEIKNVNYGNYFLKITFVGLVSHVSRVTVDKPVVDVRTIKMYSKPQQLAEVIILGEKSPVTVKRDTIEFNAGSFKTQPNANVEDLIKKMPGMEVENDGTIRAQGEQVQRVTVDGREFFGRDPKLATRNLPADAVEKVQVFDRKSDQAQFTGIDDGQKEKTINLELKEEKRNGAFGTLMAGAGTEGRFQGRASINKFQKSQQLSFLGMGNNVNEQGFSLSDYMNFSGGSQQMMGGGGGTMRIQIDGAQSGVPLNFGGRQNGIMTNYAGGLNFNKDFSPKTQLNSSYFYSYLDQNLLRSIDRINYLPIGSYNFTQNSKQLSNSDNHRVNLTLDQKLDSANSFKLTASASYNEANQAYQTNSATTLPDGTLQNEGSNTSTTNSNGLNFNSNLLLRHRFPKKGRTISGNLTFGVNNSESEGTLQSTNQYYTTPGETLDIAQTNSQLNENQAYGANVSYTEPLGNRKYLEASYNIRTNLNQVDRQVWDESAGARTFNQNLSSLYESNYLFSRPALNLRINKLKYNFVVGAAWQQTRLKGELKLQGVNIDRTFENILPSARFNYDFSNFKHLRLDYETSMREPTIQQLQPVVDNSDPLNVYVGNPQLQPSYQHRLLAHWTMFNPASFTSLFSMVRFNYESNAIVNAQNTDLVSFVRTTQPVNVANNYSVNGDISIGFRIKPLNSRINIGPQVETATGINILNEEENDFTQQSVGGSVRYNYSFKEVISIDLVANLDRQTTEYGFATLQDQEFFNQTYTAEASLSVLKNYQLYSDFNYYVYESKTNDFSQAIPILNISFSRFILKNKTGELKVGVMNLLDRSQSVVQTASSNYLQQETVNNLGRYFMFSFTYSLNKQLNPMAGRPGGGFRMIRR